MVVFEDDRRVGQLWLDIKKVHASCSCGCGFQVLFCSVFQDSGFALQLLFGFVPLGPVQQLHHPVLHAFAFVLQDVCQIAWDPLGCVRVLLGLLCLSWSGVISGADLLKLVGCASWAGVCQEVCFDGRSLVVSALVCHVG